MKKLINIRIDEKEYEFIKKLARAENKTITQFLIERALSQPVVYEIKTYKVNCNELKENIEKKIDDLRERQDKEFRKINEFHDEEAEVLEIIYKEIYRKLGNNISLLLVITTISLLLTLILALPEIRQMIKFILS